MDDAAPISRGASNGGSRRKRRGDAAGGARRSR